MSRTVRIPVILMEHLDKQLPVTADVHHQTREMHRKARAIIVDQTIRSLSSRHRFFTFHVFFSRKMRGDKPSDVASKFFQDCPLYTLKQQAVANSTSRVYEVATEIAVTNNQAKRASVLVSGAHHNRGDRGYASTGSFHGCFDDVFDEGVPKEFCFRYGKRRHDFYGVNLAAFTFPEGWNHSYSKRYLTAAQKAFKDFVNYQPLLESAYDCLTIPNVSWQECLEMCDDIMKANAWFDSYKSWMERGIEWNVRKSGRLYYPLVSLPKNLRRRQSFGDEGWGEADMKSTYWAVIPGVCEHSVSTERLKEDLGTGQFYEIINAQLTNREAFTDRRELKRAVNRDGLFGSVYCEKHPYGRTPIFKILTERYPQPMAYVESYRNCRHGESLLSRKLNQLEGRIFIDLGFKRCFDNGILTLPVHDCLACSPVNAKDVLAILEQSAEEVLGYRPVFDYGEFDNVGKRLTASETAEHGTTRPREYKSGRARSVQPDEAI